MTEIRIVRVGPHALTLLTDIRENALRIAPTEVSEFLHDDYAELHEHATESTTHYFVGFKDHSPFGYLRTSVDDGEAEIKGPFLYPEFFASGLAVQLVEHALRFVGEMKTQVIYALVPLGQIEADRTFSDTSFEDISNDAEFLKRWHDGILADRQIPTGTKLFVRLLEISDSSPDSV